MDPDHFVTVGNDVSPALSVDLRQIKTTGYSRATSVIILDDKAQSTHKAVW